MFVLQSLAVFIFPISNMAIWHETAEALYIHTKMRHCGGGMHLTVPAALSAGWSPHLT